MTSIRKVEILGQIYSLRAEESDARDLDELATYVDVTMKRIAAGSDTVDSFKLSILTAIHLAHELFEAREELQRLKQEIDQRAANLGTALTKALE